MHLTLFSFELILYLFLFLLFRKKCSRLLEAQSFPTKNKIFVICLLGCKLKNQVFRRRNIQFDLHLLYRICNIIMFSRYFLLFLLLYPQNLKSIINLVEFIHKMSVKFYILLSFQRHFRYDGCCKSSSIPGYIAYPLEKSITFLL